MLLVLLAKVALIGSPASDDLPAVYAKEDA
jgi:hypothetical protein